MEANEANNLKEINNLKKELEKERKRNSKLQQASDKLIESLQKPVFTLDEIADKLYKLNETASEPIRFNTLSNCPEKRTDYATDKWERFGDTDEAELIARFERIHQYYNRKKFSDGLKLFFNSVRCNPIQDEITRIHSDRFSDIQSTWEEGKFCKSFLREVCKADDTPLNAEISRLLFAGIVNRAFNPGCKFDVCICLIGEQGAGKSTICLWLALRSEFFSEITRIKKDRVDEDICGKLVCELGEGQAFHTSDEILKDFLSRTQSTYRDAYAHFTSDHPRSCVMIATLNNPEFLRDKTGNRRFYPVTVHCKGEELYAKEKSVKMHIALAIAEMYQAYTNKDPLARLTEDTVVKAELESVREFATEEDTEEGLILGYLSKHDGNGNPITRTCVLQLWREALLIEGQPDAKSSRKIAQILIKNGWKREEKTLRDEVYGVQRWFYKE